MSDNYQRKTRFTKHIERSGILPCWPGRLLPSDRYTCLSLTTQSWAIITSGVQDTATCLTQNAALTKNDVSAFEIKILSNTRVTITTSILTSFSTQHHSLRYHGISLQRSRRRLYTGEVSSACPINCGKTAATDVQSRL
jgi:hypothetical protein